MTMIRKQVRVEGQLLSPDGHRLAGIQLRFTAESVGAEQVVGTEVVVITDKDGNYKTTLFTGRYNLAIFRATEDSCGEPNKVETLANYDVIISRKTPSPSSINEIITDTEFCKSGGAMLIEDLRDLKDEIKVIHDDILSKDFTPDVDCNADKNAIYGRKGDRSGWEIIGNGTVLDTASKKPQLRVAGGWVDGDSVFTKKIDTAHDGRFVLQVKNGVANWDEFYQITWGDIGGSIEGSVHWNAIANAIGTEMQRLTAWSVSNFVTKGTAQANADHAKVADVANSLSTASSQALLDKARKGVVLSVGGVTPDSRGDVRLTWADIGGDPKLSASFHVVQDEIKAALIKAADSAKTDFDKLYLGKTEKAEDSKAADVAKVAETLGGAERKAIIDESRNGLVKTVNSIQPDATGNIHIQIPVVEVDEAPTQDFYVRIGGAKHQWALADDFYQRKTDKIKTAGVADSANDLAQPAIDKIVTEARKGMPSTIMVDGVTGSIDPTSGAVVIRTPVDMDAATDKPHIRVKGSWSELTAGDGIQLNKTGNNFEIKSIAKGSIVGAENVGTGEGVFQKVEGDKLKFRSIKGEGDLLVEDDGDSIKISYTGVGGAGGGIPEVKAEGHFVRALDAHGTHQWIDADTLFVKKGGSVASAVNANVAQKALVADDAKHALKANEAKKADNAANADNATNALNADNATNADSAKNADNAHSLDGLTKASIERDFVKDTQGITPKVRVNGKWVEAEFLPKTGKAESAKIADELSQNEADKIIAHSRLGVVLSINKKLKPDGNGNINLPVGFADVTGTGNFVRSDKGWVAADFLPSTGKAESAKIADDIPQSVKDAIVSGARFGIVRTVNNKTPDASGNVDLPIGKGGGIVDPLDSGLYLRTNGNWIAAEKAGLLKKGEEVDALTPRLKKEITDTAIAAAPVTSVNGNLGAVTLDAQAVHAAPELLNGINGKQYALSADGTTWTAIDLGAQFKKTDVVRTNEAGDQQIIGGLEAPKLLLSPTSAASSKAKIEHGASGLTFELDPSESGAKKFTFTDSQGAATIDIDDQGRMDFWFDAGKYNPKHGDDSVLTLGHAKAEGVLIDSTSVKNPSKTYMIQNGSLIEADQITEPSTDGMFVRTNNKGVFDWRNVEGEFVRKNDVQKMLDKSQTGFIKTINGNSPDASGNFNIAVGTGTGGGSVTSSGIADVSGKDANKLHVRRAGKWVLADFISQADADTKYATKGDLGTTVQLARNGLLTTASARTQFMPVTDASKFAPAINPALKAKPTDRFVLTPKGWVPSEGVFAFNGLSGQVSLESQDDSILVTPDHSTSKIDLKAQVKELLDANGDVAVTADAASVEIHSSRTLAMDGKEIMVVSGGDIQFGGQAQGSPTSGLNLWAKHLRINGKPVDLNKLTGASTGGGSSDWASITNKPAVTIDTDNIKTDGAFFRTYEAGKGYVWSGSLDLGLLD